MYFIENPLVYQCQDEEYFFCQTTAIIITVGGFIYNFFYLMLASLSAYIKENEKKVSRLTLLWNSMLISFYTKSYSFNEAQKNEKQRLVLFMTCILPISLFLFTLCWIKILFYSKNDFTTFFSSLSSDATGISYQKEKAPLRGTRREGR